jgi:hypothetical protein
VDLQPGWRAGNLARFDTYLTTPGQHTITLKVTDSGGKSITRQVAVTLTDQAPQATIAFPATGAQLVRGVPYVVQGSATDPNDGPLPCTSLLWSSTVAADSINGQSGCAVQVSFATTGTRTLGLRAMDSAGHVATTYRAFTVVDPPPMSPPIVSITLPTPGTLASPTWIANPAATVSLSGSVTDDQGEAVCSSARATGCIQVTWKARTVGGTFAAVNGTYSGATVRWTPSSQFPSRAGATPSRPSVRHQQPRHHLRQQLPLPGVPHLLIARRARRRRPAGGVRHGPRPAAHDHGA